MSGKLIIVNDEAEIFTRSTCNCDFCVSTHKAVDEWGTFVAKNRLQRDMLNVIEKIEQQNQTPRRGRRRVHK